MDLKRDKIILIQTGVDPERMAALEAKAIDAAMLPGGDEGDDVKRILCSSQHEPGQNPVPEYRSRNAPGLRRGELDGGRRSLSRGDRSLWIYIQQRKQTSRQGKYRQKSPAAQR